ncbi:Protein of unknown function (DUF1635 [Striga hermonthica]|uniref:Uncharacterized protein n=1 Tax=Striga hermonthica TaxID=68872 RepID=A0A9N7MS92_STRHE|nr:Protein of unknown function (DUF1635 [Striga hermonthica]
MEQLGQKLLYTTLELEKVKSEGVEETRKNKEYIRQLIHLLRYAIHERDEAKKQLHDLLKPNSDSNSLTESPPSPVVLNGSSVLVGHEHVDLDRLVRGRALPQKGKFLDAVLRAGPLLQTLLLAGPLPRWRNPPQYQPHQNQMMPLPLPLSFPNAGRVELARDHCSLGINGYVPSAKRQRFG